MATQVIKSLHYNGDVEINFYPDSHRYKKTGERTYLVSPSSAVEIYDKSTPLLIWAERLTQAFLLKALEEKRDIDSLLIEEAINQRNVRLEEAASVGSRVHEYCEKYIKGESPEMPQDDGDEADSVRNGILAFLRWVGENDIKFLFSEKFIYSKKYDYAGVMDLAFTMGVEKHRIIHAGDFKTSGSVYMTMAMQLAAYQEAESEEYGTEYESAYILRLDKNTGEFEAKEFTEDEMKEYFKGFLCCLKLKKMTKEWDKTHGYYSKK